jgi:hypothetical protein
VFVLILWNLKCFTHTTPSPVILILKFIILLWYLTSNIEYSAVWQPLHWPLHLNHLKSFVQLLCSCIHQSRTLCKVQYPADRDVIIVTWYKMTNHLGLFTSLSLNMCPFKWRCPVSSLWKIALSLPLSRNGLPVSLVFPACPALDHCPGNPCRDAKDRFRSSRWMWRALPC